MSTRARRGRPRTFDTDTVLGQAVDLLWRRGASATTTRALESALGLNQSSLYNAFGSKQALVDRAVARYESMIEEALLAPLETPGAGLSEIDRFFVDLRAWITEGGRHGCLLMNLFAEEGGAEPGLQRQAERYRERLRTAFRGALSSTSGDADARADQLVLAVLGLNLAARCHASAVELDRLLASTRTLVAAR